MKKLLLSTLIILCFAVYADAASYTAYFSNDTGGNPEGTDSPVALTDC